MKMYLMEAKSMATIATATRRASVPPEKSRIPSTTDTTTLVKSPGSDSS